jgi:hypothetical protein
MFGLFVVLFSGAAVVGEAIDLLKCSAQYSATITLAGRQLGCLMFSYAVKSLPARDEWIGWQEKSHKKHLDLVANNNRFLIFPWVKVKCLASKALSMASRQLADDWEACHGYRPVLLETFVDLTKFDATCYRAANWHYLSETKGRVARKNTTAKTP